MTRNPTKSVVIATKCYVRNPHRNQLVTHFVPFAYFYAKCYSDTSTQSKQPSKFQLAIFPNETKLAFNKRVLNVRQMSLKVTFCVECSTK